MHTAVTLVCLFHGHTVQCKCASQRAMIVLVWSRRAPRACIAGCLLTLSSLSPYPFFFFPLMTRGCSKAECMQFARASSPKNPGQLLRDLSGG